MLLTAEMGQIQTSDAANKERRNIGVPTAVSAVKATCGIYLSEGW